MSGIVAIIVAIAATVFGHGPSVADKPPCVEARVTVANGEPTPCDLIPGQILTVTGSSVAECADMGGAFIAPSTCEGVDF